MPTSLPNIRRCGCGVLYTLVKGSPNMCGRCLARTYSIPLASRPNAKIFYTKGRDTSHT